MTPTYRPYRRWSESVVLLPLLLPIAACDGGSASAEVGRGIAGAAEDLVWTVVHSAGFSGPDSLLAIDPASGRVARGVEFENLGDGLAVGEGAIWATDPRSNAVLRLDLRSGRTDSIPLGEEVKPESLVVTEGAVWVASGSDLKVRRIDPGTREVVAEIQLDEDKEVDDALRLAAGGGSVWAVQFFGDHDLHRIDPATSAVTGRIERVGDGAVSAANAEDASWVTSVHDGRVHRIDPAALEVIAEPQVGLAPLGVAVGDGAVWVANRRDESVARVDPSTNRLVATIRVPGEAHWVAASGGSVWVGAGSSLVRIDPTTNQIVATTQHSGTIGALAAPR